MKLLRNPEIRKSIISNAVISIVLAAALFILCGKYSIYLAGKAAAAALVFGLIVIAADILRTKKRMDVISELSSGIDRVLHNPDIVLKDVNDEGELAILSSEISKMLVCLRSQANLLKKDKIRLTDAIADIFHQMRTPLTSMNLSVTLLSDENLDYEKRIQLTRELKRQLARMSWLTEALLKISKIDAGTAVFEKKTVFVKDLIEKASQPFLIPMELRGQNFYSECGNESFKGDLSWSAEALGNLIKNSMEHTPDGGTVRVCALETALYTQIIVEDDGEGFDPSDIPNLFQRFYKGSNASEGSIGIGLALSRAIISNQNGTIKAENRDGGGARFIIKFYKNIV